MRLALYEPDIPQNTGTILRLAACLGLAVDIIEPCGFLLDDRRLRRAGMDYLEGVSLARHSSWAAYCESRAAQARDRTRDTAGTAGRLLLLTTRGDRAYTDIAYRPDDTLLLGRESAGVPEAVHACADRRLVIPMQAGARSLNVALAAAMVAGEALRQLGGPEGRRMPRS